MPEGEAEHHLSVLLIVVATLAVSLLSFVGILFLSLRRKASHTMLHILIALSAGTTLGTAFFDLLPETLELVGEAVALNYVIIGFVLFFFLERFIYCYHEHGQSRDGDRKSQRGPFPRTFVYLNLIGDGIHNLLDGMIIAASFLVALPVGVITTLSVALHELPQEMGDYAVLIYGGLREERALLLNLLVALTSVLGGLLAILFIGAIGALKAILVAIAAGGFIYLSASELIPELQDEKNVARAMVEFAVFVLGLVIIWYLGLVVARV